MVPHHKDIHDLPENYQQYLANTPESEITWDSILDQQSKDANLLRFIRQHFRAASVSPCGHGAIYEQLTFTSLSPMATDLLSGSIPPSWHGNDALLREFLTSFIVPDHIKNIPKIPTSLTPQDIHKGFSQWKERTSTSPSGRHLGHYKSIILNDTLLSCLTKFLQLIIEKGHILTRWCNAVNIMTEKIKGIQKSLDSE